MNAAAPSDLGPAVRRIDPPAWMIAPGARRLFEVFDPQPLLFVGGCVRDALLGQRPADIDLATALVPEAVIALLKRAGIKALPTGIAHGTVTALLPPGQLAGQFEITTLRRDVATDGRHAEVAFGTDWRVDAERRDFTINALYADAGGAIFDPMGGLADLEAHRVRFIGDPSARVAEDYLRVLRFFRFHARFGGAEPDAAALAACGAAADRLGQLSGERVRDELLKIMALPRAGEALGLMQQSGVLAAILPGHRFERARFERLAALSEDVWLRLVAILPPDVTAAIESLKLSRAQQVRLAALTAPPAFDWAAIVDTERQPDLFYAQGAEYCRDLAILLAFDDAVRRAALPAILAAIQTWRRPVFPLRGSDLLKHGLSPGPNISLLLKELEAWWREGGFTASRDACLNELRQRVRFVAADEAPTAEGGAPSPEA